MSRGLDQRASPGRGPSGRGRHRSVSLGPKVGVGHLLSKDKENLESEFKAEAGLKPCRLSLLFDLLTEI